MSSNRKGNAMGKEGEDKKRRESVSESAEKVGPKPISFRDQLGHWVQQKRKLFPTLEAKQDSFQNFSGFGFVSTPDPTTKIPEPQRGSILQQIFKQTSYSVNISTFTASEYVKDHETIVSSENGVESSKLAYLARQTANGIQLPFIDERQESTKVGSKETGKSETSSSPTTFLDGFDPVKLLNPVIPISIGVKYAKAKLFTGIDASVRGVEALVDMARGKEPKPFTSSQNSHPVATVIKGIVSIPIVPIELGLDLAKDAINFTVVKPTHVIADAVAPAVTGLIDGIKGMFKGKSKDQNLDNAVEKEPLLAEDKKLEAQKDFALGHKVERHIQTEINFLGQECFRTPPTTDEKGVDALAQQFLREGIQVDKASVDRADGEGKDYYLKIRAEGNKELFDKLNNSVPPHPTTASAHETKTPTPTPTTTQVEGRSK